MNEARNMHAVSYFDEVKVVMLLILQSNDRLKFG